MPLCILTRLLLTSCLWILLLDLTIVVVVVVVFATAAIVVTAVVAGDDLVAVSFLNVHRIYIFTREHQYLS